MNDLDAVIAAVERQSRRVTPGISDMRAYHAKQVHDESHREVLGPLMPAAGASGVIQHQGVTVAKWGDPAVPEMAFSATKSIVSLVAGIGAKLGLLRDVTEPVLESVALPEFATGPARQITWEHLLRQTSQWQGELWGKPAAVDAQSRRPGIPAGGELPGTGWEYNDVRVNLLCLALTALFQEPLGTVLARHVLGESTNWAWNGYSNSYLDVGGQRLPVVSGGAHWGGGLYVSAEDLARIGQLYLRGGQQVIDADWIERSWRPGPLNPDYGYLWWLNSAKRVFPDAPSTGVCARGNGGQHLLWLDPARELVVATHWSPDIGPFLGEISAYFPADSRW